MALIETTKDGRPLYRVRWNYRTDAATGREVYDERRFRDRAEAVKLNREKTAGHTTTTETITVRELATIWFKEHVNTDACQLRTQRDYEQQYRLRIEPYLGRKRLSKLTLRMVGDWRRWMQERGTGARTVNKSLDSLKAMIRWGRSEGLTTNSMIDDARRSRQAPPKPANPLEPSQVRRIAGACKYLRDATMIYTAAFSGLRWSELRALRWSDVNLETGEIVLVRSLDRDRTFKSTKSNRQRIVPILDPGVLALKEWQAECPQSTSDLVFPTRNGQPLSEFGWYGQRLPKIREACGIHFDLHELRDTYASILIATGVDSGELTLWLGHRSIQTTLDRYAALFPTRRRMAVQQANERLRKL